MRAAEAGSTGAVNEDARTNLVVSRRALMAGLVAVAATGKIEPAPNLRQKIDEAAANLAALMNELHGGGSWYAEVDHEDPFVLIGRDLAAP
ncbi:hypothetical protein NKJ74_05600 [Mesorhizobium sp. M0046]|uniref:hypothetical protein n=1 Tax=Mesorhizobium sp. M0046 TaxID=2956858 RepID=UPI0033369D9A